MTIPTILGLSGSLRAASGSTATLHTLADLAKGRADLVAHPLHDIPLYNADHDGENAPESVRALKAAIAAADGIVMVTPEYNYGMSGVLKNAIDWASRPAYASGLKDKPVLIVTVSAGLTGGLRAQGQLRYTLAATLARVVTRPEVAIPGINAKVENGALVDEAAIGFVAAALDDLLRDVARAAVELV
ncbi:NADPH-dependent FMN reductase [Novosphingobium terrae]|uniref:NADPH-dependent FMN reductase n=1 Tax=Novosphingobium terrae TaxID=2726189 RepID=UPI00197EE982|nr:NADPH-dependent FMN reductase [Novosphingobium terrae]